MFVWKYRSLQTYSANKKGSFMIKWPNREKVNGILRNTAITFLILIFLLIVLSKKVFIVIKSGERGVQYDLFTGTQLDRSFGEGLHIISPLNTMYIYDMRIQKQEIDQEVISRNGLRIQVKYSVLFRPDFDSLSRLHDKVGPTYPTTVVLPTAESWTRKLVADLNPEQIFLLGRGLVEMKETDSLAKNLRAKNIIMEGYMISYIKIPDSVSASIERKYCEEQLSQEYDFRLAVESKERYRKDTEALGLREFRTISGIDPVKWKSLDVTEKVGTSLNTKLIFMGNSSTQIPFILNDGNIH